MTKTDVNRKIYRKGDSIMHQLENMGYIGFDKIFQFTPSEDGRTSKMLTDCDSS